MFMKEGIVLIVYVDDILIGFSSKSYYDELVTVLKQEFTIKELGETKNILGMVVKDNESYRSLSLTPYIEAITKDCDVSAKVMTPYLSSFDTNGINLSEKDATQYRGDLGRLAWIANLIRPDLAMTISEMSCGQSIPLTSHRKEIDNALAYVKNTKDITLNFYKESNVKHIQLTVYVDATYAHDKESRLSRTGILIYANSSLIHWYSGMQKTIAASSAESEYVAIAMAVRLLRYFIQLYSDLGYPCKNNRIFTDNAAALRMVKYPNCQQRTKHIDVAYKSIYEQYKRNLFTIEKVKSEDNPADILTNRRKSSVFDKLKNLFFSQFDYSN